MKRPTAPVLEQSIIERACVRSKTALASSRPRKDRQRPGTVLSLTGAGIARTGSLAWLSLYLAPAR
jgi:hypothetical protein